MSTLNRNFTALISSLALLMPILITLSIELVKPAEAAENQDFPVPVSVKALMVTLIDHSAHYIWDYAAL